MLSWRDLRIGILLWLVSLDRKLVSMTNEEKDLWTKEASCSSLLFDTKLFVCKHLLDSMYMLSLWWTVDTIKRSVSQTHGILIFSVRNGSYGMKKWAFSSVSQILLSTSSMWSIFSDIVSLQRIWWLGNWISLYSVPECDSLRRGDYPCCKSKISVFCSY